MKKLFIVLFLSVSVSAFAQDTITHTVINRVMQAQDLPVAKMDTNRVFYSETDQPLRYYQYSAMLRTGEYVTKTVRSENGDRKIILQKQTADGALKMYNTIKDQIAIRSPKLKEGMSLDISPLLRNFKEAELNNKAIVMVFFHPAMLGTEAFPRLNEFFQTLDNLRDVSIIAITPAMRDEALAFMRQRPLANSDLVAQANSIANFYELASYPSFVITDRAHKIQFATMGLGRASMPVFKKTLQTVLKY